MIRFRCPCGKKLKADEELVGRRVKCTQCGKVNRVPLADDLETHKRPKPGDSQKRSDEIASKFDFDIDAPNDTLVSDVPVVKEKKLTNKKSKATKNSGTQKNNSDTEVASKVTSGQIKVGALGLAILAVIGGVIFWMNSGAQKYPETYEAMVEVKYYRLQINNLKKAQRMLRTMKKSYLESGERSEKEIADVNQRCSPLLEELTADEIVAQAYQLLKTDDHGAKTLLVKSATDIKNKLPLIDAESLKIQEMLK